jgi:hypothetical protein
MIKNPFGLVRLLKNPKFQKLTLSKLAKGSANSLLEYQYGWRNLEKDIVALATVLPEVRAHQYYLESTANRYVSAGRSTEVTEYPSWSSVYIGGSGPTWQRRLEMTSMVTKASFSLDIMRPESAKHWSTMDLVLQRLGANDVCEAIWDWVPFSFVVDWFVHINKIVALNSIAWNRYMCRRIGYSYKTKWNAKAHFKCYVISNDFGQNSGWQHEYTDPACIATRYTRVPGFPGNTQIEVPGVDLNTTQIASGIALLVQKM